ncbi:MAG TPA: alpha/beta hydrolase [Burkholderiaceae bacterium]|nr:alpha/beta hydrolase [Burkholderiaceae bacterium]HQR75797.1 alpha/beta hydrolase [Burkholderiaceae bacterium]
MSVTVTEHWIDAGPGRMYARRWRQGTHEAGDAAAVVLFHDSLGCVELWRDFPARLATATHRTVVAYDRLGFGRSDPHPGKLPVDFIDDEAASSVPRLLDGLGLQRIVPFGHSVGGGMAVATAARAPQRCEALVTESAQTFVEDVTVAGIVAAKRAFQEPGQIERLKRYHGSKARWVLDAWIETWLSPAFERWDLEPTLRRVFCPTLAIHGDRDEYGSPSHPGRIARLVQGPSRAIVLEACGHVPHREKPEAVLAALTGFLPEASLR